MNAQFKELYGPWKKIDDSTWPTLGKTNPNPVTARPGSRLRSISTDELINLLMTDRAGMQVDRATIGRELRARLGGVLSLAEQEAAAIERMINGSATADDVTLLRHALTDTAYGDSKGREITVDDDPPATAPEHDDAEPNQAKSNQATQDSTAKDSAVKAVATQTPEQPGRSNYRYMPTIDLIRYFTQDRTRFSHIELDLMLDELTTRAGYFKDQLASERLKLLGQLRWGLLSDEDALRLTSLLPRTIIEIMQLFESGPREISPGNLFASMELIARGGYGGWMTGHTLASCKQLIKKLLLVRLRSGKSSVSDKQRSAINDFVEASGPGKDAVDEWHAVAALL